MLYRDPYATLALLARDTRQARLGPLVTNTLTRHPAVTANAVLTIQELSGGRAVLGLGTGDSAVRRVGARPMRLEDLEPAVAGFRTLLGGGELACESGRFAIRFAGAAPPPVYVAATGLRALEVAGRVADGVIVNVGRHPAVLDAARERIRTGALAAGRKPEDVHVIVFFFCAVDPDGPAARARLTPSVSWFWQRFPALCARAGLSAGADAAGELARFQADYARYDLVHSDAWDQAMRDAAFLASAYVDAFAIGGTAGEVVAQLRAVQALGVEHVVIRPPSHEDWRPTVRAFGREVIPAVRGASRSERSEPRNPWQNRGSEPVV
jgi:5,10-methylenetetrahydromethanopterin reductase